MPRAAPKSLGGCYVRRFAFWPPLRHIWKMNFFGPFASRLRCKASSIILLESVLLGSMALASCGGATQPSSAETSSSADGGTDGTADSGNPICDGRAGIRLAAAVWSGPFVPPGVDMLSENGSQYLLVSGHCEAWVLSTWKEPLKRLTLSNEQAKSLARDFRLGAWGGVSTGFGCPDAHHVTFRFGRDQAFGVPCGLKPDHPFAVMNAALLTHIESLYAQGVAVEGDVRYLLVADPTEWHPSFGIYRNAPLWPLATSPETIAIPLKDFHGGRGSRHATNDEASLLRALRTSWLDGSIGSMMLNFIPVVGSDDAHFQLYARDSSPWENASGLLADDLTWD